MNDDRSPSPAPDEADDLLIDHLLQQEIGGRRPPDLASRVSAADAARLNAAAARVDTAAHTEPVRSFGSASRWVAAAATVALTIGATWWLRHPAPVAKPAMRTAQQLLDEFHAAMPSDPVELRDAARRLEAAPAAVPVMRAILELHRTAPEQSGFGSRIVEFEYYAALLGDAQTERDLQERAASGEPLATAELLAVEVATRDGEARAAALTELARLVPSLTAYEDSVQRWLETAELTRDEALRVAANMDNESLRDLLLRSAEQAEASPRRLVGHPLELAGRLVDDTMFRTTSLRGSVVLVCFWASWCEPSLRMLDQLSRAQSSHPELSVVCVSCDYASSTLRNYLAERDDRGWIHFFDRTRPGWHELATECGVRTLPFVMLVDRDGVVRDVDVWRRLDPAIERILGR